MRRELLTTSYAVLGWLQVRPWPIYELAGQTRRNLRYFWPRADSRLYEEPKNLVAHGLAKADRVLIGKRPRTTYSITPKGRAALKSWMARPTAPPSLEFESLVRVFFAESATPAQLIRSISAAEQLADEIQAAGRFVATEFLHERHPFPKRMHLSGLVFDFLWSWAELLRQWSARSRAEIATWKTTAADPRKAKRAGATFRGALRPRANRKRAR
jgi:PadR family transcriptional regulator AphA